MEGAELALADWSAAKFLLKLLNDIQNFDELLGSGGKLFLLVDGEKIVSIVTLTRQDCIRDKSIFPWLGFLFTYPDYRGNRYSEKLLKYVEEEEAKSKNYSIIYLEQTIRSYMRNSDTPIWRRKRLLEW